MQFTLVPENYASAYAPLVYEFSDNEAPRDLTVEVSEAGSGELIFRKRLLNTSAGAVDIAPLLRHRLELAPQAGPTGFLPAGSRMAAVRVAVEGVEEVRIFRFAERGHETAYRLCSTMPPVRLIAPGEMEELTLLPGVVRAELDVVLPSGSETRHYTSDYAAGWSLFRLDCRTLLPQTERLVLRFYDGGDHCLLSLGYTVVPPPDKGTRIAWYSRRGSIEHYTFPVRELWCERQTRGEVRLADGKSRLAEASAGQELTVVSAYERRAVREALCEIGTSPAVWLVSPTGVYRPVTVVADDREIVRRGRLEAMRFTFRSTGKGETLWS